MNARRRRLAKGRRRDRARWQIARVGRARLEQEATFMRFVDAHSPPVRYEKIGDLVICHMDIQIRKGR